MAGAARLIMVIQNIRQDMMQNIAIRLARRSAVRSRASSPRQPDLSILWKSSIFQRWAYQSSFSMASAGVVTGRSVISRQSIGGGRALQVFHTHGRAGWSG